MLSLPLRLSARKREVKDDWREPFKQAALRERTAKTPQILELLTAQLSIFLNGRRRIDP